MSPFFVYIDVFVSQVSTSHIKSVVDKQMSEISGTFALLTKPVSQLSVQ